MLIGRAKMLEAQTIEKEVEKSLVELYPYTYKELVEYIKKRKSRNKTRRYK